MKCASDLSDIMRAQYHCDTPLPQPGSGGSKLPFTGSPVDVFFILAVVLFIGGVTLVLASRNHDDDDLL